MIKKIIPLIRLLLEVFQSPGCNLPKTAECPGLGSGPATGAEAHSLIRGPICSMGNGRFTYEFSP